MNSSANRVAQLAWVALAAQVAFIATWVVSGALQEGYSHLEQHVSELGAGTAKAPWLVNAGLVALGAGFGALAAGLGLALPRSARAAAAVALLAFCGALFALSGLFALECAPSLSASCESRLDAGDLSWQTYVHGYAGLGLLLALPLTPFALAWSLWPRLAGRLALAAGGLGVAIAAGSLLADFAGAPSGLVQRLGFAAIQEWAVLVAIGLLVWSHGRPRPLATGSPGGNHGLEPFRFLASGYDGSGVVAYSPWLRWLGLPREFTLQRGVDYEGSAMWVIRDSLRFAEGPAFDRTMVARPLTAERMHLTGDDIPGGADAVLFPGGLALEPCWFLVPYWGVPWPQLWRGEMRLHGDDTLRGSFDVALLGFLPLCRVEVSLARVRSEVHAA